MYYVGNGRSESGHITIHCLNIYYFPALNVLHCRYSALKTINIIYVFVCCQVQQAAEKYSSLLDDPLSVVNAEYLLWRRQWTATAAEQRPDSATAALNSCNSVKFRNVHRLLAILGTLPVTTCESKRVFSKLQKTLTSIRSTMPEDRLEALLQSVTVYIVVEIAV